MKIDDWNMRYSRWNWNEMLCNLLFRELLCRQTWNCEKFLFWKLNSNRRLGWWNRIIETKWNWADACLKRNTYISYYPDSYLNLSHLSKQSQLSITCRIYSRFSKDSDTLLAWLVAGVHHYVSTLDTLIVRSDTGVDHWFE